MALLWLHMREILTFGDNSGVLLKEGNLLLARLYIV